MAPNEPGDIAEDDTDEHVYVDRDSTTVQGLVVDKYEQG